MCQRVYVASRLDLPTVSRGVQSPLLEVRRATDEVPVLRFLQGDLSNVYVAGGHVECGCGFPAETTDGELDPKRLEAADVESLHALGEWLRPACRNGGTVRLYLCWAGQEGESPESARTVSLSELREPGFRLKHS
jgi:hypothetical protein